MNDGLTITDATLPSIIALTLEMEAEAQKLKDNLKARLLTLPDNPKINRISNSPRCFTMLHSDMGTNWSPFHHDFKSQYNKLAEIIDGLPLQGLAKKLEEIIKTKKCRKGDETISFHPDVIKYLAQMLGVEA